MCCEEKGVYSYTQCRHLLLLVLGNQHTQRFFWLLVSFVYEHPNVYDHAAVAL